MDSSSKALEEAASVDLKNLGENNAPTSTTSTAVNASDINNELDGPIEKQNEPYPVAVAEQAHTITFPDGGLRAWLVAFGAWCVSTCSFGYISAFGVYQSYYEENILSHETPSAIAWIGSLQLFLIFFSGIFTGYLFDAGYGRIVLGVGSALVVIAIFTTAECTQLWQFILAQGITGGMGAGFIFLPATAVITHWFKKKRALVYGILATGSSAGGVIVPIMLNRLITEIGFKWAVRCAGFLVLGCLICANLLISSRLPPRTNGKLFEIHHFKDLEFLLFCIAGFLIILGLYTPIFYLSSYAQSKGVGRELSFYMLSILNATSILGRLIPNIFADKIGPSNILYPASAIAGVLCFCWLATSSAGGIIGFACVYGPASGSYVATIPAVIANLTKNMNEIGMRTSLCFAFVSFAALAGTPITGAMMKDGSFTAPACFAGAVIFAGVAAGLVSRQLGIRRKGTWRI